MRKIYFVILCFILLGLLLSRFYFFYHNVVPLVDGRQLVIETILHDQPKVKGTQQSFSVTLDHGERVFVTTSRMPLLSYGQLVRISGVIQVQKRTAISTKSDRALESEKIVVAMRFPHIEAIKKSGSLPTTITAAFLQPLLGIREQVIRVFQQTLPKQEAALLLGIVLGIKQDLPKDFSDKLSLVGITHIIAASGMNVTMVGSFLLFFFLLFLQRQGALVAAGLGIILYAAIAGFEPAIVRASLMGIALCTAQVLGRQYKAGIVLCAVGWLMLMYEPYQLFAVGFQLSFLATLGILYIKPLFDHILYSKVLFVRLLKEDLTTTLSAQLLTLPILLSVFGSYSVWAILVNVLVLWTILPLMIVGGFGVIASIVFAPLATVFLWLTMPLLLYIEWVVSFFAKQGGVVQIDFLPWQFMVSYYCFLLSAFTLTLHKQKWRRGV